MDYRDLQAQVIMLRGQKLIIQDLTPLLFRSWYAYIERHFDFYKLKDLFYLASELSNLIFQYHRLCTHAHKQLDSLVATGKLEGQRLQYLKQEWNLRRERHNIFINKWENIAKNINTATGEMSCHDYYELLKTLE